MLNELAYIEGQRAPKPVPNGFVLSWGPPVGIAIGIPTPYQEEIDDVRYGRIVHAFGRNPETAWLALRIGNSLMGEAFFTAGLQPQDFTDERLAELRATLTADQGLMCHLLLVDTVDQRIMVNRFYSWSNVLSQAFLDACESTRNISRVRSDQATNLLLRLSTAELAKSATVNFILPAREKEHGSA